MSDDIDRAQEHELELRQDAFAAQQRRAGLQAARSSALRCSVCDEPIPLARRRAVPGVQTCVDCQRDLERAVA